MSDILIRNGGWDDEEGFGALLAVSFTDDPFVRWIMPNAHDFILGSKGHPRRAYSAAFEAGTVFVAGDFAGAALWLPPSAEPDRSEEIKQAEPTIEAGRPIFPPEFQELISQSAAYCPSRPHWYLALIAVDPAYRGRGVGTSLMKHCLAIVDADGMPAYLESTNRANLTLYRRFGFQPLAEVRVGFSPPRFPMLRPSTQR